MSLNPVHKGKRGENELCRWLDINLGIDYAEREYNQAKGGADVIVEDFIIEVKRREALDLESWWYQVAIAKQRHPDIHLIPIVAYRQNRKPWGFLLPANLIIGIERSFVIASEKVFIEFAKNLVKPRTD